MKPLTKIVVGSLLFYGVYKAIMMKKPSPQIIEYLKNKERLRLESYQDAAGLWTTGYGHLIKPGEPYYPNGPVRHITKTQAEIIFAKDLVAPTRCVNALVQAPLSQNQFDALVSLVFNIGCGNFASSTLLRKLNLLDYKGAADEFPKWRMAKGVILAGLETRRKEERQIFIT